LLIDFYKEINSDNNHLLEIVFVSADGDEKSFQEYYSTMPWLAVPFKTEEIEELKDTYEIYGIPMLMVFNGEGKLIDKQGRELVEQQGLAAFDTWLMKA
jgi:nucleoredoxin